MFRYGSNGHNKKWVLNHCKLTWCYTSGVWKLYNSQWKVDSNHCQLVEGSMGMYHWEILCLDIVETATTQNDQATANYPDMSITYTSGVWKLYNSQGKVNTNHHQLVEGSIGIYNWD